MNILKKGGDRPMPDAENGLALAFAAEAANVPLARAAIGGLAQGLGMEEPTLGDLKTIVTEACSNVVRHAYPSEPGIFEVEAFPVGGNLSVVVRDFGEGMRARLSIGQPSMHIGLGLISELSSHFEISDGSDGGTEVRMQVPLWSGG